MLARYLDLFRVVWIGGRYGGGKTALAVWLAMDSVKRGVVGRIAANLPIAGEVIAEYESFTELAGSERDCAIIYDESWQDLGADASAKSIRTYLAYLRKRNHVMLLPSVLPLARGVRVVQVFREFNGLYFGLPLWVYRYTVHTGAKRPETGRYMFPFPARVFDRYDHLALPGVWRVYQVS